MRPGRPRKSAGGQTACPREVEAGVEALADEVWTWREKVGAFGRTVTVKVRKADFRQLTRGRTGAGPFYQRAGACGRENDPQTAFDCKQPS